MDEPRYSKGLARCCAKGKVWCRGPAAPSCALAAAAWRGAVRTVGGEVTWARDLAIDTDSQMSIKQMRRESFTMSPTWYRGNHQLTVTGGRPAVGGIAGRRW